MYKEGREHRGRDSRAKSSKGPQMLVVGIDIGAESHHVAVVDRAEAVVVKATAFAENVAGYQELFALLARAGARGGEDLPLAAASAEQDRTLVVMEATGHYWQNLFAALVAQGYAVALVNPLRTHRFAGEELARTKTDSIDCLQLARFGAQKRPAVTCLPEAAVGELRELVRLRARLMQDVVDRVNQLHRLVDLGFPEFTRYLKNLNTQLATAILRQYPTAAAVRGLSCKRLAKLNYDGRHRVGEELARQLIAAAASRLAANTLRPIRPAYAMPARISRLCASGLSSSMAISPPGSNSTRSASS
jgi:transposase